MFDLLAKSLNTNWDSKAKAAAVLKIETALADASMDRILRRNPESRNHPMTTSDLPGLTPDFQWTSFISEEHTPSFTKINVGNPDFFKKLAGIIDETNLDDLKTYLTWHYCSIRRASCRASLSKKASSSSERHSTASRKSRLVGSGACAPPIVHWARRLAEVRGSCFQRSRQG